MHQLAASLRKFSPALLFCAVALSALWPCHATAAPVYETITPFETAPNSPEASLFLASDGFFYGTMYSGGNYNVGSVFKVDPATGTITTVAEFTGGTTGSNRGANPQAGLVSDGTGYLWGTTYDGGANEDGTVFKIEISSGTLTTIVDFSYDNGAFPQAGLVSDGAGYFWGTTHDGGSPEDGTVFKIEMSGGTLTTVVAFGYANGASPQAGLVSNGAGYLWGTRTAAVWSKFDSFALPTGDGAGVIFLAETSGGDTTSKNKLGLWAYDSQGQLRRLLRNGTTPVVGSPVMTSFTLLNASPGSFGVTRSYNETGSVAVLATFADKTQALLRLDIP